MPKDLTPSAVCFLLHYPSKVFTPAQVLPGGVPYGARTFLEYDAIRDRPISSILTSMLTQTYNIEHSKETDLSIWRDDGKMTHQKYNDAAPTRAY